MDRYNVFLSPVDETSTAVDLFAYFRNFLVANDTARRSLLSVIRTTDMYEVAKGIVRSILNRLQNENRDIISHPELFLSILRRPILDFFRNLLGSIGEGLSNFSQTLENAQVAIDADLNAVGNLYSFGLRARRAMGTVVLNVFERGFTENDSWKLLSKALCSTG